MSLPDTLGAALGEEDTVAEVSLGGEDLLAVTPSRTLVYRADGLLSDESVDEYSHDVERIDVNEGRRKAKLTLDYGLDGEETLKLPRSRLDDALHPMLAGALSASDVTGPGESVLRTFRFSELTLVVTDHRFVKHIGSSTWDPDFETFDFEDVTDLDFEEGTVATSIVLTLGNRQERFKAPNEEARAVRETLLHAVCDRHGVGSLEELRLKVGDEDSDEPDRDPADFGAGPDPLDTSGIEGADDVEPMTPVDPEVDDDNPDSTADPSANATATDAGTAPAVESSPESTGTDRAGTDRSGTDRSGTDRADATGDFDLDAPRSGGDTADSEDRTAPRSETSPDAGATTAGSPDSGATSETDGSTSAAGSDGNAFEGSGFEPAGVDEADVAAEVAELRDAVEAQSERIDRQAELIEQLVEELRRGR